METRTVVDKGHMCFLLVADSVDTAGGSAVPVKPHGEFLYTMKLCSPRLKYSAVYPTLYFLECLKYCDDNHSVL